MNRARGVIGAACAWWAMFAGAAGATSPGTPGDLTFQGLAPAPAGETSFKQTMVTCSVPAAGGDAFLVDPAMGTDFSWTADGSRLALLYGAKMTALASGSSDGIAVMDADGGHRQTV